MLGCAAALILAGLLPPRRVTRLQLPCDTMWFTRPVVHDRRFFQVLRQQQRAPSFHHTNVGKRRRKAIAKKARGPIQGQNIADSLSYSMF
jgi:hypothetical protein